MGGKGRKDRKEAEEECACALPLTAPKFSVTPTAGADMAPGESALPLSHCRRGFASRAAAHKRSLHFVLYAVPVVMCAPCVVLNKANQRMPPPKDCIHLSPAYGP